LALRRRSLTVEAPDLVDEGQEVAFESRETQVLRVAKEIFDADDGPNRPSLLEHVERVRTIMVTDALGQVIVQVGSNPKRLRTAMVQHPRSLGIFFLVSICLPWWIAALRPLWVVSLAVMICLLPSEWFVEGSDFPQIEPQSIKTITVADRGDSSE
jgi:hypothetical protein